MNQLDLFDDRPSAAAVLTFPHARRLRTIRAIADSFVERGFEVGNQHALVAGARLIAELNGRGMPPEQISAELDQFIRTWQALATERLLEKEGDAA